MKLSKLKSLIKEEIKLLSEQQSIPCSESYILTGASGCSSMADQEGVAPNGGSIGQFYCGTLYCNEFTGDNCWNDPNNPGYGGQTVNEEMLPFQYFTQEECCSSGTTEYYYNNMPPLMQANVDATCPDGVGPCSNFESGMQAAVGSSITISDFCDKCKVEWEDGTITNSWDPLPEAAQYCGCCPPGQSGPGFIPEPSTDTSDVMPLKDKSKKDLEIQKLQKLAGLER